MPNLLIDNFAKGWATDNELDADKLYSFLTFINSDVDFERGSSIRRPGYNRHNATSLTGTPKQFYSFTNLAGETRELVIAYDPAATAHYHLFVLSGGAGYEVRNYSTSPTTTLVFDSRDNYPFITVGNRVLFADDNGWYWSDYSSLVKGAGPYTYECYQVGIDKPTFEIEGIDQARLSHEGVYTGVYYLDTTTQRKVAQSFTPARDIYVDAIRIKPTIIKPVGESASTHQLIVSLYTNVSGSPGVQIEHAIGRRTFEDIWEVLDAANPPAGDDVVGHSNIRFNLQEKVWLTGGTTYWIVVSADSGYSNWYNAIDHHAGPEHLAGYAGGSAKAFDGTNWNALANDLLFVVGGGLVENGQYTYAFTYYNSIYAIESEPLDYDASPDWSGYMSPKTQTVLFQNLNLASNDVQVDKVRIYRTKTVGNTFYLVAEINDTATYFWDNIDDDNLGSELQTGGDLIAAKHLRLKDADGNLIVPYLLEIWNGRIWAVKFHDNALNYSKMLEEAGATGVAGDSIYDYFPADNKWTLDSEIRSIRKRGEDEFEVYTSNNNVHVFRGGSDALNPPPDLSKQEMVIGANCFDDRTLQEYKGRHIFVTSDKKIKAFNGTVDLEELGDKLTKFLLQNGTKFSSCIYKSQYCLGCDTDGDNVMDSVIIFDLSQPRITNWRRYQYLNSYGATGDLMKFYNLFVTRDARMFACPADLDTNAFYVVQLMTGYSDDWTTEYDDGVDITRIIQTQFIIPARRARWTRVELTAFYPHGMFYGTDFYGGGQYGGAETIPTYVIYAIGKSDEFCQTTIAPQSSRDISGHVAGIRLLSEECSVRIEDTGDKPDEIRSLTLYWSFN